MFLLRARSLEALLEELTMLKIELLWHVHSLAFLPGLSILATMCYSKKAIMQSETDGSFHNLKAAFLLLFLLLN